MLDYLLDPEFMAPYTCPQCKGECHVDEFAYIECDRCGNFKMSYDDYCEDYNE